MDNNKFFKFLFWFITIIFASLFTWLAVFMGKLIRNEPDFPAPMAFYFIGVFVLLLSILIAIAIFVYRDAPKRGLDRWVWMTISVYVPNLLGFIIYIIVRSTQKKSCLKCGKPIKNDYEVCPYCSNVLNQHCKNCGKTISQDWKVCPYCKETL